jgi:hypothetical protein
MNQSNKVSAKIYFKEASKPRCVILFLSILLSNRFIKQAVVRWAYANPVRMTRFVARLRGANHFLPHVFSKKVATGEKTVYVTGFTAGNVPVITWIRFTERGLTVLK